MTEGASPAEPERAAAPYRGGERWLALLVPVTLVFLVSAPLWLRRALPLWDGLDFYYPAFSYLSDSVREGRLPLWDPYSNGGEPFFADPQRGVLSPALLAVGLVVRDTYLGFVAVWVLHWAWAAVGASWLARRLGADAWGATAAASAYALSGFFVSHAEHPSYVYVASWLPWILGLADEAVGERRWSSAMLAGAALGLCAIDGGYPILVMFNGVATFAWLALRHTGGPQRRRKVLWIASTLGIMVVVLAVSWSPLLHAFVTEASAVSARLSWVPPELAIFGSPVTLRSLVSLFFPHATVSLRSGLDFGADVSMTNSYVGFAVVPLAVTWAVTGFRRERRWPLVAFAVLSFLVSLGGVGGVRLLLHYLLPPLQLMRFNAPFRLYWILAACLAAGGGITLLMRSEKARRTFAVAALVWLVVGVVASAALFYWMAAKGVPPGGTLPRLLLPSLVSGPVIVMAAWLLRWRGGRATAAAIALAAAVDVAAGAHVNHGTIWRPDDGLLARIDAGRGALRRSDGAPPPRLAELSYPFNIHLLLHTPVLRSYTSFTDHDFNEVLFNSRFAGVLCGAERFWLAPATERVADRDEALREIAATGPGDPAPAFIEDGASAGTGSRVVPGTYGSVEVVSYAPEQIILRVAVPDDAPALMTSVERSSPGWRVTVDGNESRALTTNLFFRGVLVEPGTHLVVWRYAPEMWWPLVSLSLTTLFATLLAAVAVRLVERRRPPGGPSAAQ